MKKYSIFILLIISILATSCNKRNCPAYSNTDITLENEGKIC
jgi:hypothetical protein